ncbi:hypothetical protein KEM56_006569 [Ascosphaera pollenicola]|nr:hypothetical protein KEM56_006569 [Ascosphaera pollenicola]
MSDTDSSDPIVGPAPHQSGQVQPPVPPPLEQDTGKDTGTTSKDKPSIPISRRAEILENLKRHRHDRHSKRPDRHDKRPTPEESLFSDIEIITGDSLPVNEAPRVKRPRPEPHEDYIGDPPDPITLAASDDPSSPDESSDSSSESNEDESHSDSPSDSSNSAADSHDDELLAEDKLNRRHNRIPCRAATVAGRRRNHHHHVNRVTDPRPKKYLAKGKDPLHKLSDDLKMLSQWSFSLDMKFDDDAPLFPDGSYKVRYTMTQINSPLWENLAEWLDDRRQRGPFASFKRFMRKIRDLLDIKDLAISTRMELQDICQGDMTVTDLHNKLTRLWRAANTSRRDRIYTFRQALAPYIHDALDIYADHDFKNDRGLLKKACRIKRNRRCKRHAQDRFWAKSGNDNSSRKRYSGSGSFSSWSRPGAGSNPSVAYANANSSGPQRAPFVSFTKPDDWPSEFHAPIQHPKLLQDRDRNSLPHAAANTTSTSANPQQKPDNDTNKATTKN